MGEQLTPCAGCGRPTKTIGGMCPNCGHPKTGAGLRRPRRTGSSFGEDFFDLLGAMVSSHFGLGVLVMLALTILLFVSRELFG